MTVSICRNNKKVAAESLHQLTTRPFPGRRFFAAVLYDSNLAFWIAMAVASLFCYLSGITFAEYAPVQFLTMVVYLARDYRGMAIGKYLLGLKVVDFETGKPASLIQSIRRNFLIPGPYLIYQALVFIPFVDNQVFLDIVKWIGCYLTLGIMLAEFIFLWKGNGRRIADRIAGTIVVSRPETLKAN